ncbi:MAG TPA: hypothetical protein VGC11_03550, partial [Acidimicrobiia bacterium]
GDTELDAGEIADAAGADVSVPGGDVVPAGTFLVGAATATLAPAPEVFGDPGDTWQTEGCTVYDQGQIDADHVVPDPADVRGWPAASPDCVYLGGFGIAPTRPAQRVGHGGVWVRTVAISNGQTTFVYSIADVVGWFARYDSAICADCGILDVRQRLAADLGVDAAHVVVGSTHTHAGADTYGGWGGIPDWYRAQLRDAAIASAKQAVANLEPATITTGEVHLRQRNNERRDTYHSTADTGATFVQARRIAEPPGGDGLGEAGPDVIATWATYAAHPTIVSDAILHADWPGAAARRFEALHGGVGLVFEGGLGNVSISGTDHPGVPAALEGREAVAEGTGYAFADEVSAAIGSGMPLVSNEMVADVREVTHPTMTNPGLTTLASLGLFDREFTPNTPGAGLPGVYGWSKAGQWGTTEGSAPPADPRALGSCTSAGPTVITAAGAHRIGELAIAFAPGEIFSNLAEVVKEEADSSAVTMVLGQTNDALGYIIQSFEFDTAANVATEYGTQTNEYEEVFAIDRCFGDHVLADLLAATSALGF